MSTRPSGIYGLPNLYPAAKPQHRNLQIIGSSAAAALCSSIIDHLGTAHVIRSCGTIVATCIMRRPSKELIPISVAISSSEVTSIKSSTLQLRTHPVISTHAISNTTTPSFRRHGLKNSRTFQSPIAAVDSVGCCVSFCGLHNSSHPEIAVRGRMINQ